MLFVNDKRGMMFDIMRIVFMVISIVVGNIAGAFLSQRIPFAGALLGALVVGIVIYLLYSLLAGQKPNLLGALVFGILNYVSTVITSLIGAQTNLAVGIFAIIIQAMVLSLLWGWIGGQKAPEVKTGLSVK